MATEPVPLDDSELRDLITVVRDYTMLGQERLVSLFELAKAVCQENLPGNFVECGVAAGGSSALLAAAIARYTRQPRQLFSFDTFTGLPETSPLDTHDGQTAESLGWGAGTCAAPESSLLEICQKLGVRHLVEPVKGLFEHTLPANRARIGPIALLHLDGDWYFSTRDILENLYERVVPGGRIQIDDYGHWQGCRRAVTEFDAKHRLNFQLHPIDSTGVWMIKQPLP